MTVKNIFFCFLFLFTSLGCFAQNAYWGVRAGMSFNKVGGIELDNSMYTGFNAGLFGTFMINDRFSFTHELSYAVRGFNGALSDGHNYDFNLKYIDIPWMLNFHINQAVYVQAGVQPSVYAFFKPAQYDTIPYTKYNANAFDFSGFVGASIILKNNLLFGVRLNQSISQTFNISTYGGKQLTMHAFIGYAINRKTRGKRYNFGSSGGGR
ncbi:MAG: outer membrane beta-barrel protein [Cytophagaceae bacterium]